MTAKKRQETKDATEQALDQNYQKTIDSIIGESQAQAQPQLSEAELDRREDMIAASLTNTYRNYIDTLIGRMDADSAVTVEVMIQEVTDKKSPFPAKLRWLLQTFNPQFIGKMISRRRAWHDNHGHN